MENLFILICELGPFTFIITIIIVTQPFYNYYEYFLCISCGQNLSYKLAHSLLAIPISAHCSHFFQAFSNPTFFGTFDAYL